MKVKKKNQEFQHCHPFTPLRSALQLDAPFYEYFCSILFFFLAVALHHLLLCFFSRTSSPSISHPLRRRRLQGSAGGRFQQSSASCEFVLSKPL